MKLLRHSFRTVYLGCWHRLRRTNEMQGMMIGYLPVSVMKINEELRGVNLGVSLIIFKHPDVVHISLLRASS
jgi:hypothetical protein